MPKHPQDNEPTQSYLFDGLWGSRIFKAVGAGLVLGSYPFTFREGVDFPEYLIIGGALLVIGGSLSHIAYELHQTHLRTQQRPTPSLDDHAEETL